MEGFRPRDDVVKDRVVGGDVGTQHFVDYVRGQLLERYGDTRLYGGGLRVRTTLNPKLQRAAYEAVYGTLDRDDDPAGALVAIDDAGHVKAMVGGKGMQPDAEQSPFAKVNFATGVEGGGSGRQPGSAFKPFVLAEAVSEGYSVESAFDLPAEVVFPGANAGKDYPVRNYDDAAYGRQNLIEATRVSSNTVYAQLADELGTAGVADTARRLGIRSEIPTDQLSVALGTVEVSVLDMADAYLTFATRGVQVDPVAITEVTDADGEVLDEFTAERERVLETGQADVINEVLQGVVRSGTGTGAGIGRPLAGKTGTTQDNGDAWFAGYTPGLATAVWMGYPEGQSRPMSNVHGVEVTGGTFPADMFRRFMSDALSIDAESYGGEFVAPADLGAGKVFSGGRSSATDPVESTSSTQTTVLEAPASSTTTTSSPATTTSTTAAEATPTKPLSPGMTLRPPRTSTTPGGQADARSEESSERSDSGQAAKNERRADEGSDPPRG
jgi:penicillin-binding protein 1A